jgi:hypothetical protein
MVLESVCKADSNSECYKAVKNTWIAVLSESGVPMGFIDHVVFGERRSGCRPFRQTLVRVCQHIGVDRFTAVVETQLIVSQVGRNHRQ